MSLRFDDKVAIVTGAGNGMGRAYALMLAERGATVVVNDLGGSIAGRGQDKTVADRVVAEIRVKGGKATPSYVSAVEGDKIVEQAMREFGRVDIIINNAGIGRTKPFENYRDEDWDMVYQTHLGSAWKINKAAWAIMQKQKYGRIINVSSPTGYYGMTTGELASYTAAKAAMHGFTLTLAREGAKYNIKVNSLAPNARTRMENPANFFGDECRTTMDPYGSIAPVVTFLVHESCPATGHYIECGGGWVARSRLQRAEGALLRPDDSLTTGAIKERFPEIIDFNKSEIPEIVMAQPGGQGMGRLEKALAMKPSPKGDDLSYAGKVVVVTGAGAGLGKAYAVMYAKAGAKVVVNDLGGGAFGEDPDKKVRPADLVVEEIRKMGGTAVANYDSVVDGGKIIDTAIKAFGAVHIVINNAGILRDKSFMRMSEQDWNLIQEVHAKGQFAVARAAWPHFVKQKFGRLINTTSSVGLYGNFGQANYSAAKAAMIGLSNELAIAGRDLNISVNTLAPGAGTRLTATVMPPEQVEVMKPDFVAPLVGYLTHPDVFMTAGIYESSVGWNAAVRVQRSGGAVFAVPFTAEQVKERWDEVNNFDDGRVEYPTSMGDVRNAMLRAAYYNKGLKDSSKAKL